MQSLTEMTDEEIESFTRRSRERLTSITSTVSGMLDLLGCNRPMLTDSLCAIKMYPALLQVKQFRDTIFNCKTRLLLDCKSGAIKCRNKRLFAIPDVYAWCERLFLGIENPQGILADGEVAAREFIDDDEVDILRSPSLYQEHCIRTVNHDPEVYKWFKTKGIYTSCHDLISRVLQFDVDGDQLNATTARAIIDAAKRTIKKYDIVPLFYDAIKAKAETITRDSIFNGLKRAYEMGNIGTVSNGLTKIWNKDNPDIIAAACMVKYNNFVIDAAKTGIVDSYENYPIGDRVKKAVGSATSPMPYWFKFSKNGRARPEVKRYAKQNNSTMNRICSQFEKPFKSNINMKSVPQFNWRMLSSGQPFESCQEVIDLYLELSNENNMIQPELDPVEIVRRQQIADDEYRLRLSEITDIETAYENILQYVFDNAPSKIKYSTLFFRIFGEIYLRNLEHNLCESRECEFCKRKVPLWENHDANCELRGICSQCGNVYVKRKVNQCMCSDCKSKIKSHHPLKNG